MPDRPRPRAWPHSSTNARLGDQPPSGHIELIPSPVLPKTTLRTIAQAGQARDQARSADRLALEKTRRAAAELAGRGISMRDSAAILGISHQRVHQLLAVDEQRERKTG